MLVSPPRTDSPVRHPALRQDRLLCGYVMVAFGIAFVLAGLTVAEALLPLLMVCGGVTLTLAGLVLARRHPHG